MKRTTLISLLVVEENGADGFTPRSYFEVTARLRYSWIVAAFHGKKNNFFFFLFAGATRFNYNSSPVRWWFPTAESVFHCFLIKPSAIARGGNIFQLPWKWSERKNSLSFHQQLQFIGLINVQVVFSLNQENLLSVCNWCCALTLVDRIHWNHLNRRRYLRVILRTAWICILWKYKLEIR